MHDFFVLTHVPHSCRWHRAPGLCFPDLATTTCATGLSQLHQPLGVVSFSNAWGHHPAEGSNYNRRHTNCWGQPIQENKVIIKSSLSCTDTSGCVPLPHTLDSVALLWQDFGVNDLWRSLPGPNILWHVPVWNLAANLRPWKSSEWITRQDKSLKGELNRVPPLDLFMASSSPKQTTVKPVSAIFNTKLQPECALPFAPFQ